MNMSILETQLVMVWHFTESINGCRAAIKTLSSLERMTDSIEESDTINDAIELAFAKGNLMQLRENQIAWAGEL